MSEFANAVKHELERARKLHPGRQHSFHEGYAVLLEEVRELEREVFKKSSDRNTVAMRDELVQIAAMAQRMAEDSGLSFPQPSNHSSEA